MKYQLLKWKHGLISIYEVTDDLSMERLIWTSNKGIIHKEWESYTDSGGTLLSKKDMKWITKEEVFTYIL